MRIAVGDQFGKPGHHREASAEDDGGDFCKPTHELAHQYDDSQGYQVVTYPHRAV